MTENCQHENNPDEKNISKEKNSSLSLDEFGIIRDKTSKSTNSCSVGEMISSRTDDDLSEEVLAGDTTGGQNEETESLTEFEEIERLIEVHTFQDSGDELPELPIDLEQHILSGRVSRENSFSEKIGGDNYTDDSSSLKSVEKKIHSTVQVPLNSNRKSSFPLENQSPELQELDQSNKSSDQVVNSSKLLINEQTTHHDTGYGSEGRHSTEITQENQPLFHEQKYLNKISNSIEESSHTNEQSSSRSVTSCSHDFSSSCDPKPPAESVKDKGESGADIDEIDHFMIPTTRQEVGDSNMPESLVATFGTTEDFEKLLQQQLQHIEEDEKNQNSKNEIKGSGDHAIEQFKQCKLSKQSNKSDVILLENISNPKLKLSKSERRFSGGSLKVEHLKRQTNRTPAANRIKRVTTGARVVRASSYRDSSDDVSVRSDASKSELRSKLKEECRSRKREEEVMRVLQSNYDALLMKYAEAENTIDHLRLGAKINLYASVPEPSPFAPQSEPSSYAAVPEASPNAEQSHQVTSTHFIPLRRRSEHSHFSSGGSDNLVESSLQLPEAATKEFLKVALQLQAKDLKDKVDSFHALLQETDLSSVEQQQVMEDIEGAMRNLEADYLRAIDQHAEDQQRASIATDGAIDACQSFDPDQSMEADIISLNRLVKNLQEEIDRVAEESSKNLHYRSSPSSPCLPENEVDEKFDRLLKRYRTSSPFSVDFRSPSSHFHGSTRNAFRTYDASNDGDDHTTVADLNFFEHGVGEGIPNKYLDPPSFVQDNCNTSRIDTSVIPDMDSHPELSEQEASPPHSLPSKIPRPVALKHETAKRGTGVQKQKNWISTNAGTDSGFVGSESSRQSQAGILTRLSKVNSASVPAGLQPVSISIPTSSSSRAQCPLTSHPAQSNNSSFEKDRSKCVDQESFPEQLSAFPEDSLDDVSTTSTVRDMLRPSTSSEVTSMSTAIKCPVGGRSRTSASARSRASTTRSAASSARDSILEMIRGEIKKLRDDITETKAHPPPQPFLTSTPRHYPTANIKVNDKPLVGDALQTIQNEIKELKEEFEKEKQRKSHLPSESIGMDPGTNFPKRRTRSESRGRCSRSADSGQTKRSNSTIRGRQRTGSISTENNENFSKGFWAYIPPAPSYTPASSGRLYQSSALLGATPCFMVVQPSTVYAAATGLSRPPIIANSPNVILLGSQRSGLARIYRNMAHQVVSDKPKSSFYVSPKQKFLSGLRKANLYVMDSDDDSFSPRRNKLEKAGNSIPLVAVRGSDLDASLERAEKSAKFLRFRSRDLYRSARENVLGARILSETL